MYYMQYYRKKQVNYILDIDINNSQIIHCTLILMKTSDVVIFKKQYEHRKKLFMQDPQSDFFVVLRQKIYPLHRKFLTDAQYFAKPEIIDEKVHMLSDEIDSQYFQMIMGYFYGFYLEYQRMWGVESLFKTIQYFKISTILKKMYEDIENNFEDYGFFLLVSIAKKFNLKWLLMKCSEQLTLMNFEQLNFNRYDLYQLDGQCFEDIIKLHELLRINQNIIGLRQHELKRIIKQYCKANNTQQFQLESIFNNDSTLDEQNPTDMEDTETRKRNNSQPQMSTTQKINKDHINKAMSTNINIIQNSTKNIEFDDQKSGDVYKLKIINNQIQQKGTKLLQQIGKVNLSLKNKQESYEELTSIDEKFKRMEKTFKLQEQKCIQLKKQMQKLSPSPKQPPKNTQSPSSYTEHHMQQSMVIDASMNIQADMTGKSKAKSVNSSFRSIPQLGKDQNFDI